MSLSRRLSRSAQATAIAVTVAVLGSSFVFVGAPTSSADGACAAPSSSFPGGVGSSGDPYQISSVPDLMLLQSTTSYLGDHFILINDVDLASCQWDGGIGSVDSPFTGILDGNDHAIANMNVNVVDIAGDGVAGLFTKLGDNAVVKDLTVTGDVRADTSVEGAMAYAGGIAGQAAAATIQGSTFRGSVRATSSTNHPYAGGLVGSGSYTTITSSGAAANVSASPIGRPGAGGLAGLYVGSSVTRATITDSWAVGAVFADGDAQSSAGGLVGVGTRIAVTGSFTNAEVRTGTLGFEPAAGGLIGFGIADITDSFSRSDVNGGRFAGGLVGWLIQQDGFDTIQKSFAAGTLVQGGMGNGGKGGLVGYAQWDSPLTEMQTQDAVWDTTTAGTSEAAGITNPSIIPVPVTGANGFPTADMTSRSTFTDLLWDVANGWDPNSEWGICANYNEGLPFLTAPFATDVCTSPSATASISPSTQTFSGSPGTIVSLPPYSATGFASDPLFSITPSPVEGVTMDPLTGAITGTVGIISAATYTVTANTGPYLQSASATVIQDASNAIPLPGQATRFLTPRNDNGAFQAVASRPDGSSLVVSYGIQTDGATDTGILTAALVDPEGNQQAVTRVGGVANEIGNYSQPSVAYNPVTGGWITCFARLVDTSSDPTTSQPMCQYLNDDGSGDGDAFPIDDEFADRWNQNAVAYSPVRQEFLVASTAYSTGAVGRWVAADGSGVRGTRIPYGVGTTPAVQGQGGVDLAYSSVADTFGLVMRGKRSGTNEPAPWMFMLNGDGQPLTGAANPVRMSSDLAEQYSNGSVAYSPATNEFIMVAFTSSDSKDLTTRTFSAVTGTPSDSELRSPLPDTFEVDRWRPAVSADQAGSGYLVSTPLKTSAESSTVKVFVIPLDSIGAAGEPTIVSGSSSEPAGNRPRITYRSAFCDFVVSYQLDSTTWGRQAFVQSVPGSTSCGSPTPTPTPTPSPTGDGGGATGGSTPPGVANSAQPSTPTDPLPSPVVDRPGSSVAYQQPAVARPVSGAVVLVPAKVAEAAPTRTMRQDPAPTIGSAPIVMAVMNQPVKLLVPGLTPGASYEVRIKASRGYVELGSVTANTDGQLQLPVFRTTRSTQTTIAIVSSTGEVSYVKVSTTKSGGKKPGSLKSDAKATLNSSSKPVKGTGSRR